MMNTMKLASYGLTGYVKMSYNIWILCSQNLHCQIKMHDVIKWKFHVKVLQRTLKLKIGMCT